MHLLYVYMYMFACILIHIYIYIYPVTYFECLVNQIAPCLTLVGLEMPLLNVWLIKSFHALGRNQDFHAHRTKDLNILFGSVELRWVGE